MKILINLKLRTKILLLSLIPVLIICAAALVISNTAVKGALLSDTKKELRATASAVLAAYDQNSGDYFQNKNGDVWKGAYNVSRSETLIDGIADKTGIAVTFFYGSSRLVTSLIDKNGDRITGSQAGEFLEKNVLQEGNSVFTNRVSVDGTMYFGYYIPVLQNNSDEVIGMIFAGLPVSEVMEDLNLITRVFVIAIVIIILLTSIICILAGSGISKGIENSIGVVMEIAEGNLNVDVSHKNLQRKDEVGILSSSTKMMQESLSSIISTILGNTGTLNSSVGEMNEAAEQAKQEMDLICDHLKQVSGAAQTQTGNTESVTDSIEIMENMIKNNLEEVGNLQQYAENMKQSSKTVKQSLMQLESTNKRVLEVIERIQKDTEETDISVEKIKSAVILITDIAEETNLLSLNASIEAARAGESGKGFAVVAQQISSLAEQSNQASHEIEEMVSVLDENSQRTIQTMDKVQAVINDQSENVSSSRKEFDTVEENVRYVAGGVDYIKDATQKLSEETLAITGEISKLKDLAIQNEEHAEGTLEAAEGIFDLVSNINQMSGDLGNSANEMSDSVSKFVV